MHIKAIAQIMGSISAIGLFKVIRQQLFVIGMSTILDNGLRFLHGRFASQVGDSLLAAGFRDPVLERETFTLTYADALTLMRELRAIGATHADPARARGLAGKQHLKDVIAAYETFREDGRLPATYEVVYAIARAPEPGQPRRSRDGAIASIPIDSLRGSRRRR